jgi:putative phage-type endonuclease
MSVLRLQQGSQAWLDRRRETITATDIGVIVGESPWKDPYTLAAEKLGLIAESFDEEVQQRLDIGTLMQPALLGIYTRMTKRPVRSDERHWRLSDKYPWASASLDGVAPVDHQAKPVQWRRIVEAKWTNSRMWRGDEIPGHVYSQVQWQLFVTGWDVADIVVLTSGEPKVYELRRDDTYIDNLLWFALRFREMLAKGELPAPDGSEATRQLIGRLHPQDDGTILDQTPEWFDWARQLAQAKAATKAAEENEGSIGNAIRTMLGDASGVKGCFTYKKNKDSEEIDYKRAVEAAQAAGLDLEPWLTDATSIKPGPRVLRLTYKEAGRD